MAGTEGDDEDFPLDDHPGPGGLKAGDPGYNRARDLQHLDVAAGRQPPAPPENLQTYRNADDMGYPPAGAFKDTAPLTPTPSNNPVVAAWQAFKQTTGYTGAINSPDPGWAMFMAGYAARDSQP
jgi:hypothetical protein